jgi:hypothetical protein
MSTVRFACLCVVALLAVLVPSARPAIAQGCIDGQPIRPTYTSGTYQEWGGGGVAVSGTDVFLAGETSCCSPNMVAVMRLTGSSGYTQIQQISTGQVGVLRAAADMFFVGLNDGSNGSIRIYRRQSTGTYSLATTITGPVSGEGFAWDVSVNEDATVLAVGAPYAGSAPNANAGKVYVYARNVTTGAWTLQATLQSPSGPVFDTRFGHRISASGSRIAVGEDGSASARVFLRSGSTWAQEASVTNPSGSTSSFSASLLRMSGDFLWARWENSSGTNFSVFERVASAWTLRQTLVLSNVQGMGFSNGTLSVSRPISTPTNSIQVQAFRRAGTTNQWSNFATVQTAALDNNSTWSLAMAGDLVVVNAPYLDFGSVYDYGAAFLFDIDFTDCNGNGVRDECDIASGTATDTNANGIPDSCENRCVSDLNGDGFVDGTDLGRLLNDWGACPN